MTVLPEVETLTRSVSEVVTVAVESRVIVAPLFPFRVICASTELFAAAVVVVSTNNIDSASKTEIAELNFFIVEVPFVENIAIILLYYTIFFDRKRG